MTNPEILARLEANFHRIKKIIQEEEMWERVPEECREFSVENLWALVKFSYFGGFIDVGQVRELLLLERGQFRRILPQWYEEVRQKGCWLC